MILRILEPEVMDTPDEARDYDSMDHREVNRRFVADFLHAGPARGTILDVGTGTAQIPIEFCHQSHEGRVVAIDLADEMLILARRNVAAAGLEARVQIERVNARGLPYADGAFDAVMSNSIIHHIPEPATAFAEMVRVCKPGGRLFVRDLLRPMDQESLLKIVEMYAGGANDHQRSLFGSSLHAALMRDEVGGLVAALGYPESSVQATSDRHWTWLATKP